MTSMREPVSIFEEFLSGLASERKGELIAQSDAKMEIWNPPTSVFGEVDCSKCNFWNVIFLWDPLSIVRRLAIFVNRTVVSNLFPKSFLTNTKLLQSWDFLTPNIKMSKEIYYSDKYEDDKYEYRHVMLPKVRIINWFDFSLKLMSFQGSCQAGA